MNTDNKSNNYNDNDCLNELLSVYSQLSPEYKEVLVEQSKALLKLQKAHENFDFTY